MSKRLPVRLPDALVGFIDDQVERGDTLSRTALITRAVRREQRRAMAARDLTILATTPASDVDRLAAHSALTLLDID